MAIAFHKDVSSFNSLYSTILKDRYVQRWFMHLILQPKLRDPKSKMFYLEGMLSKLGRMLFVQSAFTLLLAGLIAAAVMNSGIELAFAAVVTCALLLITLQEKKKCVAEAGMVLIKDLYREEEVRKMTLYQLAEILSKKYDSISLVDAIYSLDQFYRNTILFLALSIFIIYPFGLGWPWAVCSIMFYFLIVNLSQLRIFYNRIK